MIHIRFIIPILFFLGRNALKKDKNIILEMFKISPSAHNRQALLRRKERQLRQYDNLLKTANNLCWEDLVGATLDTSCWRVISVTSNVLLSSTLAV